MPDYSKAKVYKILNDVDDDVYIGSTCQPLSVRMAGHRCYSGKSPLKLYQKMRDIGVHHFYIELIEETPCENKEQLRAREGEYIRKYGTLNIQIAGRNKKQYAEDTKENKAEYDKKRREEKGEEINQKRRIAYQNNIEKKREQNNKCYEKNKEKYQARMRERVECPHGSKELSRNYLKEHIDTQHP